MELSKNIYEYLSNLFGEEYASKYNSFVKSAPQKFIRVNTLKTSAEELKSSLEKNYGILSECVKEIPNSLKIIEDKGLLGKTIEHISGYYYIQSLSSMLPPLVLNASEDDIVLDLCAAPGSKTTELAEMMNNKGTLISNEIQGDRVGMLVYNIDRMNIINAGIIHSKGELLSKIYTDYFDKILVDAPCSGLGIIQKKNEVTEWWSVERAQRLGELQLKLLVAAVKMAIPGGTIVYSTCTLTLEENEMVLDTLLRKYPVEIEKINLPFNANEGIVSFDEKEYNSGLKKAKRIWPWQIGSEGFFIVKLKKTGITDSPEQIPIRKTGIKFLDSESKEISKQLEKLSLLFGIERQVWKNYKFYYKKNDVYFAATDWDDEHSGAFERIGLKFGILDRNNEIVLHTNAAQLLCNEITKSIYELENQDELKIYLEGGTIKKDIGKYGQFVIKYNDILLGTAVISKSGIKSRFPRSKRTQEILTDWMID
jgi:16S rRNA (cytosine1407-C5)-methyltransferase